MSLPAFPKPYQVERSREAIEICSDGREVCDLDTAEGKREYRARTLKMLAREGYKCGLQNSDRCIGKKRLDATKATFDHSDGRGMNAAHRDDRIEKDGKPYNCAACMYCNSNKGSRRLCRL